MGGSDESLSFHAQSANRNRPGASIDSGRITAVFHRRRFDRRSAFTAFPPQGGPVAAGGWRCDRISSLLGVHFSGSFQPEPGTRFESVERASNFGDWRLATDAG